MRISTRRPLRIVAAGLALVAAGTVSCNDLPTAPQSAPPVLVAPGTAQFALVGSGPDVVISQIYGGGGNAGAQFTNDFIELHNRSAQAVSLAGWSVQYASAAGTSWAATPLTGTIQPGAYYLVQEAASTVGVALPTPDAKGTIAMGATAGKVALVASTAPLGGTCPAAVVDLVSYGTTATDCGAKTTKTLTNTTAALRLDGGCTVTGDLTADFVAGAPAPRNSGSAAYACAAVPPAADVATVTVTPATATITSGATQQFTATAYDAQNVVIPSATFTWSSSATGIATVSATGLATGVAEGDAQITATAGGKSSAAALHVNPVVAVPMPDIRFSELHYDNAGTDVGERLEVEGPAGASLNGWSIVLYDGGVFSGVAGHSYATQPLTATLSAGSCNARGVVTVDFVQIQNGAPDGMALVDAAGNVVEFLSYEGTFTASDGPAAGMASTNIGAIEDGNGPVAGSLRRSAANRWTVETANNFGSVNTCGGPVLEPPPSRTILFSGRDPVADAPVPVGFESQLFAAELVNGSSVATTIIWESLTPTIATIDEKGVYHGLAAGTATFKATATDGTSGTRDMPIIVGERSATNYVGNTLFGEPKDAEASDDFIIRRGEYTTSFNVNRAIPNWVSYRVDAEYHPSGIDRCNCFTFDPELVAAGFSRYTTGDYTGAGAFAKYGIDRGHLARSFDRTAGSLDNAATYYFSNIIPQAADLNQGPWKILEDSLGKLAYESNRSVYVIAGASGSKGTVKDEGKITIPTAVWKVAVILPHDGTLASIHSPGDLTVIAVIMPNDPGVRGVDWTTYKTTVDEVERLSGYDILAELPDNIERAVESNDTPPVARATGPATGSEGSALAFDASTSSDPDAGDALTYSWTFGDGGTATGVNATHTYADNGNYSITLTATDSHGVTAETTLPVTITNVAPTAQLVVSGPVVEGSPIEFTLANATDAPGDQATLTFAYACSASESWRTSTTSSFSCPTTDDGTFTVRAKVTDKDDGSTEYSKEVSVANAAPVIAAFTTPTAPASVGAPVSATLTYTDLGSSDTHSATLAWGDGTTSTVPASAGQVAGTHTYAAAGFYTISVTLRDDDGGTAVASSSSAVSVYDAAAGGVQAQGWLPAAGVTTAANRRGDDERDGARNRTQFSLDAEYGRGATPRGDFTFVSLADRIALRGRVFEYLVVKEQTATVRGTGLLADGTAAGFLVYAVDGKLARDRGDRVRIRIWNQATGAVLFDTEPGVGELASQGTPLGGGNVKLSRSRDGDDGQRGNDDDKRGEH
jgi:DNA/RNA endonuclease G (NUC1)/PKD repeat protein